MASLEPIDRVSTGRGIVGDLAVSPSGEHVLALHGGFRGDNWRPVFGASLVGPGGARAAPAFGRPAFALDDGSAYAMTVDLADLDGALFDAGRVQRRDGIFGGSLTLSACALADARRVVLGIEWRDDGHGWSPPEYGETWKVIDLATGVQSDGDAGLRRFERAPGSPLATPNQGGAFARPELPFRAEWPVALGRSCFVTDKRIFAAATGETLVTVASGWFEDASADERSALAVTKDGALEVWSIAERRAVARVERAGDSFECARFAAAKTNEIVAGTRNGDVVRYAWSD